MNGMQAKICHGCGALVIDAVKHTQWHEVLKTTVKTSIEAIWAVDGNVSDERLEATLDAVEANL